MCADFARQRFTNGEDFGVTSKASRSRTRVMGESSDARTCLKQEISSGMVNLLGLGFGDWGLRIGDWGLRFGTSIRTDASFSIDAVTCGSRSILKLTCWICGTNPSTLQRNEPEPPKPGSPNRLGNRGGRDQGRVVVGDVVAAFRLGFRV